MKTQQQERQQTKVVDPRPADGRKHGTLTASVRERLTRPKVFGSTRPERKAK